MTFSEAWPPADHVASSLMTFSSTTIRKHLLTRAIARLRNQPMTVGSWRHWECRCHRTRCQPNTRRWRRCTRMRTDNTASICRQRSIRRWPWRHIRSSLRNQCTNIRCCCPLYTVSMLCMAATYENVTSVASVKSGGPDVRSCYIVVVFFYDSLLPTDWSLIPWIRNCVHAIVT